jgi:hypothetical protein
VKEELADLSNDKLLFFIGIKTISNFLYVILTIHTSSTKRAYVQHNLSLARQAPIDERSAIDGSVQSYT